MKKAGIYVAIIVSIYMLLDKDILSRSFKRIVYSILMLIKGGCL